jgi:hypothetical protein
VLIDKSEELDVEKDDAEAGGEIDGETMAGDDVVAGGDGRGHWSMHSGSRYSSVADAL